ncbi:MAG: chemotaxis protein CheB [Sulfuritalea sp.]|nr:chemotaxis protein CheB [Sulfuritalea sp.]MDP1984899.1 chemotaxis protein CheB [Sulfuritalea sp.]
MDDEPAAAASTRALAFPIVGIGASAGGLEAFEAFFRSCPTDTGMAFVLVPHLGPGHESLLTEILQRITAMPVVQALDQVAVAPDHVYIIPPNREMAILNGVQQLSVPELVRGRRMPIDVFLRSLAEDKAEQAIGIILSGTATDGTLGLRAIHGAGGVCMVQEPATAKYDGMPHSAIAAGYATHILPAEKMPAMLLEVARQAAFRLAVPAVRTEAAVSGINQILLQLRRSTGHDFSLYKKGTIDRRVERRMVQNNIADIAVYARFLKDNPGEVQKLFKELLVNVTRFFRDPEAFIALKDTILPSMLAGKPAGYDFRIWVVGCASGEEAYSIAIVLQELQAEIEARHEPELRFQIYATDLDEDAIAVARAGRYPPNIALDVTPERLRRFFTKDRAGYKVKKGIRDQVVFAVQSVIKDPPFTRLDLLSCRNLLIYLEAEQQARLIPTFHYALKPGGVLFLSASESITSHPELFSALDRKSKFYRVVHSATSGRAQMASHASWIADCNDKAPEKFMKSATQPDFHELTRRTLLQSYAPASVVTDLKGDILYVYGDTGRFLRPAPGQATLNVVDMAREGLQLELRAIFLNASDQAAPTLNREVSVKTNGGFSMVSVSVRRLPTQHGVAATETDGSVLLVSFQDLAEQVKPPAGGRGGKGGKGGGKRAIEPAEWKRAEQLEWELAYAKESRQAAVQQQQAFNEDLKSINEELQSANEELQSSNEELETSKEELQSLNEEMITVNSELNAKVEQLSDVQNDLKNLLDSSNTGTLFLDRQLAIRRYTPAAVKVYPVKASDVGRPLADIKSTIEGNDLLVELQTVLDTLIPIEREVRTIDGAWYLTRMQAYRTLDNVIAGVVLSFTTVTDFKLASEAVQRAQGLAEGIIDSVSEPLIVLDSALQVVSASRSFYQYFEVTIAETVGCKIYDLGNGQWNIPALRQLLEKILLQENVLDGYVVEHDFPNLGPRRMVLNARRIVTALGNTELILLAMVAIEPLEKTP